MNQEILKAKAAIVDEVVASAKKSKSIIVVEYRGMNVAQITELRRALRKIDATLGIYKNSLFERAVGTLGVTGLGATVEGPNAFVFSKDAIAGPKAVVSFARRHEKLIIKGGIVEGQVVSAAQIKTVATLPGRQGLISMFLSCLQGPIRQFAATVQAVADKN